MKPFFCLRCRAVLGHTDGYTLQVANCYFDLKVTIRCVFCDALRKWKPVGVANGQMRVIRAEFVLEAAVDTET